MLGIAVKRGEIPDLECPVEKKQKKNGCANFSFPCKIDVRNPINEKP
jgi:hypothetical protein